MYTLPNSERKPLKQERTVDATRHFQPEGTENDSRNVRPTGIGRELGTLAKLYYKEIRYSGSNDNFDYKYGIFLDLYRRTDIPESMLYLAFPIILRDEVLDYYYFSLANTTFLVLHMYNIMCTYFEGPEKQREALTEWNNTILKGFMEANEGKIIAECFTFMISRL
jgi:hypothetical protein